ncbi:MAG: hypothetical protein A2W98_09930 [Bacteroidetes bacterium GWF2_33_38]|nr:MAG: hypothetical protein A2W98_09930 [Bacteroidetes bacterium GWF2_33_38]OFY72826.1 MAG: hypothetical protein A2265_09530 [Bacteroidetes bacterium RIFOXYA12_FULL_33_9]HBX52596.1 hypothetical protein [Bacteroidales bacterium]
MRVLLIAFSLLLYQLYSFSQEFEVKPMKLFFDSTTTTGIINIYNKSDKKNQFGIFYKDYEKDTLGTLNFLPSNAHKNSCFDEISFIPALINIEANSMASVSVQYNNYDSILRWGMLVVKPILSNESLKLDSSQIRIFPQIAVKLYCNNSKNNEISFNLSKIECKNKKYSVKVENTNLYFQRFNILIVATNLITLEEVEIKNISTEFLPMSNRVVEFGLNQELKKGKYSLAFILKDENQNFIGGEEIVIDVD